MNMNNETNSLWLIIFKSRTSIRKIRQQIYNETYYKRQKPQTDHDNEIYNIYCVYDV